VFARPAKPDYKSFRSGLTYQDARLWFWSNSENPDDWGHCSHRKVIRAMASVKRAMFDRAVEAWELACEEWEAQESLGEEIAASERTETRLQRSATNGPSQRAKQGKAWSVVTAIALVVRRVARGPPR